MHHLYMSTPKLIQLLLVALALAVAPGALAQDIDPAAAAFFQQSVLPILEQRCFACHSHASKEANGGLMLDSRSGWEVGGDRGTAVRPGLPQDSLLMQAVKYTDADLQMPPDGKLPDAEIAILEQWIAQGATDPRVITPNGASSSDDAYAEARALWSFQALQEAVPPETNDKTWPADDVDRFILARLEQQQLAPAPDADRNTWLRRVSIDLTGLPPTPEEIHQFTSDQSELAYELVVDRLLSSPGFGERWGRHWLDLVGYADQIGTANDLFAEHAWRYRDYVIEAFNRDTPYDQFVAQQIAGDLLPFESVEQRRRNLIATGFLVLGDIAVVEADKEKLRVDVVDQQVDKIGRSFLAMTIGCARCHDHKFDPIPQRDYYALAGFFYSTQSVHKARWGVWSGISTVDLPESEADQAQRAAKRSEYDQKLTAMQTERTQAIARRDELQALLAAKPEAASEAAAAETQSGDAPVAAVQPKETLQKELDAISARITQLDVQLEHATFFAPDVPKAFAVHDLPAAADMHITVRGNAHVLGDQVPRGFLSLIQPSQSSQRLELPAGQSGRSQLADWITRPENPLTARVAVNRIWQKLFGEGLVRSVDYFGVRGETPSHPELLDYLALRFMREGWSQKRLIRHLVLSHSYRMSSDHNDYARQIDPQNRLLWRMNRWRMDAEALRDSVLAVSGKLDRSSGGPSMPLEFPENVGNLNPDNVNPPSFRLAKFRPGQELQRTAYLPIIRSAPQAGPAEVRNVFDFTQPAQSSGQRSVTAVPTQALFLMNGPLLRDRARDLAADVLQQHASAEQRLAALWLRVLNRTITSDEQTAALSFLQDVESQLNLGSAELNQQRAWSELCHALLASNEFLMRL